MSIANSIPMTAASRVKSLSDPAFKAALQTLRKTDNHRNWWYVLRTYLYLALVLGGAVWFFESRADLEISWWWNVPVAFLGIALVGAGQHHLSALAHEGSHYILFRNRWLNDIACDLFCMFPLFSSIYHYRLQHLAHHQFVNDPDRDPDVSQLQSSGHWLKFPVAKASFLFTLALQVVLPFRLIRFMRIRAKYNATGTEKNPYMIKGKVPSKGAVRLGILYLLALIATLTALFYLADPMWLVIVPFAMWAAVSVLFVRMPSDQYHQSRLRPVMHNRWMTVMRVGYTTVVFAGITLATRLTGAPVVAYYILLWLVPIFTSFAFFMVLRQLVQHGNGDRGWITNTRTFLVGRGIRFAVFPLGQDYHLPHHMYSTIPHYRLAKLHELLMEYPEYREQAVVVEGYFLPKGPPPRKPTVLDVLGPQYATRGHDVHIDDEVMASGTFDDADAIRREAEKAKATAVMPWDSAEKEKG